MQAICCIYINK